MESAIKQYIDLYRSHSSEWNRGSCTAMNARRDEAMHALAEISLPKADSENYEFTDLESMLSPNYGIPLTEPTLTGGGRFPESAAQPEHHPGPREPFSGSIAAFAKLHPDILEKYYGSLADIHNPISALNTLLVRDGFILYVPKGVVVEKPVQIIHRAAGETPVLIPRRVLVILEEGAQARLLTCDHSENEKVNSLSLLVTELFIGKDARFDMYDLEETAEISKRLSANYVSMGEGSHCVIDAMTLFNGVTRNEYYCDMTGRHADLRLLGMGICDRRRRLSVYSHINHGVPECHSDELFKYAADEQARCAFTGRIHVAPGASGTEAYQANRNLIAGNEAVIKARPELEIYNDDVKCSHGCAIGQLNDQQLFYMLTRGLSEATARLLLRQAFMADIVDAIAIPSLRDRLHILVANRFAGQPSSCSCAKY